MWLESAPARCSAAAASRTSSSLPVKVFCWSCSPITLTRPGSAFSLRSRSRTSRACPGPGSGRRSRGSSRPGWSRWSTRADLVARLDFGSRSLPFYRQLSCPYPGRVMGKKKARNSETVMGNPVATKVVTTYAGRSAVAVARPRGRLPLAPLAARDEELGWIIHRAPSTPSGGDVPPARGRRGWPTVDGRAPRHRVDRLVTVAPPPGDAGMDGRPSTEIPSATTSTRARQPEIDTETRSWK